MLRWLWLSLAIVVLDQALKQWIAATFMVFETVPVMPSFNLTLVYNLGAAFSFLADQGGWQRWFFAVLAGGVSIVLAVWLRGLGREQRLLAAALALVIGGAIGNLIDRLWLGGVIDFIDLYYGRWHWPAFNIADMAIALGVILLLLDGLPRKPPTDELR